MKPKNICLILTTVMVTCQLFTGCARLQYDYPKTLTRALAPVETAHTFFGRYAQQQATNGAPGQSGFIILNDGVESFAARLLLANKAELTLDAQYYLVTDDLIGTAFINMLLQVADRGVRVRLLVDDIQTQGYDARMAALDAHPNLQVRIFNPFTHRQFRFLDLPKFAQLNRRMHNKTFTVDNQVTIIGGRNIADEYFGARTDVNFGDLDALAVGPAAHDISDLFDLYWNSELSLPVPAFAELPDDPELELQKLRQNIANKLEAIRSGVYAQALLHDHDQMLKQHAQRLVWAPYQLAYDTPDKITSDGSARPAIASQLAGRVVDAEQEFIMLSPYFVPMESGEVFLKRLVDKGVAVKVVTNSLSANNHLIVHSGYVPSRKPLLELGVELYEVKASGINQHYRRVGTHTSKATLHTKAFLLDREIAFIGSFNWDPRSINLNTELGIIIESPTIAADLGKLFDKKIKYTTRQVVLNDQGNLNWIEYGKHNTTVYSKEPDTSWWQRFKVNLMRILPIKNQL